MRIIVKGGVWKNTEDEILKAAVMKYGKNQWSRISSLLVRKSAKQCKARWYEWLDPSIRKVEWSRDEEEKLLHLAKLMPTQWRTIAQAMNGRTAAQCMEHYEKLLNAAQAKADGYDETDDPRRLRPGEIDPNPETKPARPDAVDMDDDEKEMLQEARARLANTKGKKAKRKTREKQLEEARRLASLQKRRELKAAGLGSGRIHKKLKKGIDYNQSIPFERKVPAGFFQVSEEADHANKKGFESVVLQNIDEQADKRRAREEGEARKKDVEKQRLKKEFDVPNAILQINKLNDPDQVVKRTKMALPKPQLSEEELENIVKLQQQGAATPAMLEQMAGGATQTLINDYSATPGMTPMRTPMRTPVGKQQALMDEARNLAALANTTTPLQGDENAPLAQASVSSDQQGRLQVQTPNPLATPQHMLQSGQTPRIITPGTPASSAFGRTPVRDAMSINESGGVSVRRKQLRDDLREGFSKLPKPQFEYDAELPEEDEDDDDDADDQPREEDAEDVARRKAESRARREAEILKRRSTALQRDLPRPLAVVPHQPPQGERNALQKASDMIQAEVHTLLEYDAFRWPLPNGKKGRKATLKKIPDHELDAAKNEIANELINYEHLLNKKDDFIKAWEDTIDEFVFVPSERRYVRYANVNRTNRVAAQQQQFELLRNQMVNDTKRATKLEKRLNITTGGYQSLNAKTVAAIETLFNQIDQAKLELRCFTALSQQEDIAIQTRKQELVDRVHALREQEKALQLKYSDLSRALEEGEQAAPVQNGSDPMQ